MSRIARSCTALKPAVVVTASSATTIASGVTDTSGKRLARAAENNHDVVARRPSSTPASPRRKAPTQTDATGTPTATAAAMNHVLRRPRSQRGVEIVAGHHLEAGHHEHVEAGVGQRRPERASASGADRPAPGGQHGHLELVAHRGGRRQRDAVGHEQQVRQPEDLRGEASVERQDADTERPTRNDSSHHVARIPLNSGDPATRSDDDR
ncbi:MAG: hypothetical protein V9G12_14865 [Microthrixaceae bacterium]